MTRNVYIAAPFPMLADACALRARLHSYGIGCTSRWLTEETTVCREWAEGDLSDVLDAHAVVVINTEPYFNAGTGGRHVEVGYALAHHIPVYVLGGKSNIFHELCIHVEDEHALIALLRLMPYHKFQTGVRSLR